MKEGKRGPFFPKLRVRIKDNNSSPHGKFNRFLFPFSCKFPDLNFASCVLYIYLCGTHSEPGLPVSNSSLPGSFIFVWVRVGEVHTRLTRQMNGLQQFYQALAVLIN